MLQRQLAELRAASGPSLLVKLAAGAGAAAALAAALWWRFGRGGSGVGGVGNLGDELRSVNERIAIAQQRLR